MSKHTPAPWHVTNDGEFVDHGQAALIRAVNANEADMKLIAAAPELLEALTELEDAASVTADSRVDAARRAARAAIAKATRAA